MTRGSRVLVPILFFLVVWTLTTHGKFSNSGDEPHYLMVAESLISDGDLDVANNYARGDGRWFGNETLEAGPHARQSRHGRVWSTHDIGVPIVVLPVYAMATRLSSFVPDSVLARIRQPRGLFAYSLVSLSLVALTAAGLMQLAAAYGAAAPARHAAILALVVGFSPPVLSHAFLVFPETIALFVVCAVVRTVLQPDAELTRRRIALIVAGVGMLPWLHRKYSFLVFGLMYLIGSRHLQWGRRQSTGFTALLVALAIGPQLVLHLWTLWAWGTLGGPQMVDRLPFDPANILRGALGLLFDRERGLVAFAPVYLGLGACWTLSWRAYRDWLIPIAALFVPMAAFADWSAGFSPAARYLVPLIPLAAAPVAPALKHATIRRAAVPLLVLQAAILVVVWQKPRTLWPRGLASNDALSSIPVVGRWYEQVLPSLVTGDSIVRAGAIAAMVVIVNAAIVWHVRRSEPRPR